MDDAQEPINVQQIRKFDFITDSEFRASLASDYIDLQKCFAAGAWKAVHVLSGSVVEALLAEYLTVVKSVAATKKGLLDLHLDELIKLSTQAGGLSERVAELGTIIKGYRNLIHPGRILRLKERVDKNSATVAWALLDMVIEEVGQARKKEYGYTAEQVVTKLEIDPLAVSILSRLLKETNEYERERLLREIIPAAYSTATNKDGLEKCFRSAFDMLSGDAKKKIAANFVKTLKEGSADDVHVYETAFFRASDLAFVSANDVELVKEHLAAVLQPFEPDRSLIPTVSGLGAFLNEGEVRPFFEALLAWSGFEESEVLTAVEKTLTSEYGNLRSAALRDEADSTLAEWSDVLDDEGTPAGKLIRRVATKCSEISLRFAKPAHENPV